MKILLFSNSYPPVLGGLQTVCHSLATGLACRGHTVQVIANRYPRNLPGEEVLDSVRIRRLLFLNPSMDFLKRRRIDLFLAAFWFYPAVLMELDRLIKEFRPEIVNFHYPLSQIPFVLALRRRYGFRLVVSLHGDEILPWVRTSGDNQPLRALLREADAVTACSSWLLEQAISWESAVRLKGVAIHNGVDLERFTDRIPFGHPRPYVFAYGRLSHQKGFDLLLRAFAALSSQFPEMDLILAGDGEDREPLIGQVGQLGLKGRIHFFGRATPEQVVQLLNGCAFVVIPSRWEPFGVVALEALAAGKPILATNVGGLPELLNRSDLCALLVSPTVEGLTDGLREMLGNTGRQTVSRAERSQILSDLSWEHVVTHYEEVYQRHGN